MLLVVVQSRDRERWRVETSSDELTSSSAMVDGKKLFVRRSGSAMLMCICTVVEPPLQAVSHGSRTANRVKHLPQYFGYGFIKSVEPTLSFLKKYIE